ncbi:MAG: hypothetical protein K2I72_01185 [Bacilli bacterium]|nr:hypothetical protein [Bacilli bacterium]
MNDSKSIKKFCTHNYIVCLGEDKETGESFNYCLSCGEREKEMQFHALYINASFYLEDYPVTTEAQRRLKIQIIRQQFKELMLETETVNPALIIEQFRLMIENKRNHVYQIKGKVLLPMSS